MVSSSRYFCSIHLSTSFNIGRINVLNKHNTFIHRYLSTLYSHPSFPEDKHISHTIIPEIKSAVEKYWQVHLSPPWSSKYLKKIIAKSVKGQPVSFTDFFGYLVGQQLLKKVSVGVRIDRSITRAIYMFYQNIAI